MPKRSSTHIVIRYLEHQLRLVEPGQALPSTRQVMQVCRVGPHSVAAAVAALKRRGLLEVRPQSGLYRPLKNTPRRAKTTLDLLYFVSSPALARVIAGQVPPDDSFHGQLADQIRSMAAQRGMHLRLHLADGVENGYLLCDRLARDADVKTCMTVSLPELSLLRVLTDAHLPVVNLFPASFAVPANSVTTDPDAVVACQLDPLLTQGHRYIAYLHNVQKAHPHRDMQLRREAFYRMCLEHGLKLSARYVRYAGYEREGIDAAAAEVLALKPRPTGIICADQHLPSVYAAAAHLGLKIPDDLSVVGTDDQPVAKQVDPPATTVRVPRRDSAAAAFNLLDQVLLGRAIPAGDYVEAPVTTVIRGSTGPCPK